MRLAFTRAVCIMSCVELHRLVALLNELKTLRGDGTYPDDAIREALTVCTDKSKVEGYLAEYIANHHGRYGVGHAASEEDGV